MKGYVCGVCGFISIDGTAPEKCPVCGAPKTAFTLKEDAIMKPTAETDKVEFNKKHVPSVTIVKKCGLVPEGCLDVKVRVGEILHPMIPTHYIMHIDCYHNKKYVARLLLTPEKTNPAVNLHLNVDTGKIQIIELCNLHGAWMTEMDL
jgi:superoxide reductase